MICLISLYVSFTNGKGNQANLRNLKKSQKFRKFKFSIFPTFVFSDFIFFSRNCPLSRLERRNYCFTCGLVAELYHNYFPHSILPSSKVLCAPDHIRPALTIYYADHPLRIRTNFATLASRDTWLAVQIWERLNTR